MNVIIPQEVVEKKIFLIRGQKVLMDRDLAELYGVTTGHLKRQVRRNIQRFPEEFMFQLTKNEWSELMPIWHQFKTRKHSYVLPFAFTEHGVTMLASVLNSEKAIKISIIIVKTFVKLREIITTRKDLAYRLKELESKMEKHDADICTIFEAIRQLMTPPPEPPKRRIGFHR